MGVLIERVDKAVRQVAKEDGTVKFEAVHAAFSESQDLSFIPDEDFAKAFATPVQNLKKAEQHVDRFIELIKHGDTFHDLFFPQLPDDSIELGMGGEMP